MKRSAVLVLAVLAVRPVSAQAPLAFEAASVKLNKSGDWRKQIGPAPGGRFLATNNTLRDLLPMAFGLPQQQAGFGDRTRLTGLWDYELKWTPDQPLQLPPDAPPITIDPNGPSIFTALQEQLGLKLESTRGPVDVVVIDGVVHPTED